jgi:hypothetical protein
LRQTRWWKSLLLALGFAFLDFSLALAFLYMTGHAIDWPTLVRTASPGILMIIAGLMIVSRLVNEGER